MLCEMTISFTNRSRIGEEHQALPTQSHAVAVLKLEPSLSLLSRPRSPTTRVAHLLVYVGESHVWELEHLGSALMGLEGTEWPVAPADKRMEAV